MADHPESGDNVRFKRKFKHVQPAVGEVAGGVPLRFQFGQTSSSAEGTILVEGAVPEETIEDYDRMIRIILLTTIPCTHLDIVHSSQYV